MKYHIEGKYEDHRMEGSLQLSEGNATELKDFVMHGLPSLIQDLFEKLGSNMKEDPNISQHERMGVLGLIAVMCQNRLSEYLTESIDKMLGDEDKDDDEDNEDNEGSEINPRQILSN